MSQPIQTGHLRVRDGALIYWEVSGNPQGKPVVFLHGGPGGGTSGGYRRHFDPERFCIIGLEQRGCGRSRPLVTEPGYDLAANTTGALVADLEELRTHLGVEAWLVFGVSWGTTLALAYAQAHPQRVTEIVLAAVTTTSRREVQWITEEMGRIFPEEWARFVSAAGQRQGESLMDAWYRRITDPDPAERAAAAVDWCRWENVHISLDPQAGHDPRYGDPEFRNVFATLVIHYWRHAAFLEDGALLTGIERIAHIPGVLIHGRLDVSSPLETAWELHRRWPASELVVVESGGHGGTRMMEEVNRAVSRFTPV